MSRRQSVVLGKDWYRLKREPATAPLRFVEPPPSPFNPITFYTPEEIAGIFKVKRDTVYQWIAKREIIAHQPGRHYRVQGAQLNEFMNRKINL